MSEKILIASDSTTDLGEELISRYGIKILPLGVTVGGKTYTDGVDINPDMIYDNYNKTGELPKTSAANIAQFEDMFKEYTQQGYSIIMFTNDASTLFASSRQVFAISSAPFPSSASSAALITRSPPPVERFLVSTT